MIRSVRYPLHPTKGQASKLAHLLEVERRLYNDSLAERKNAWEQDRRSVSKYDQFKSLNGMAITKPELGQYGTCPARGTLTRLDLAYQAFFRRCKAGQKPGHPRFKGRGRWDSVNYPDSVNWKVDLEAKRLYLMGVGHIKVRLFRDLPGTPKTIVVKREGRKWWVSVQCEVTQHGQVGLGHGREPGHQCGPEVRTQPFHP